MSLSGPHQAYASSEMYRRCSLSADRRVEGSVELEWEVFAHGSELVDYDYYRILRKVREHPRDEDDGYLLDSGALLPAAASGTIVDDNGDSEGTYLYYSLFCRRVSDGEYRRAATAHCMVTELSLSEVSERMVPSVFHHPGRDPRDSEDPAVFKACFFDPAFGEIDSLLRAVFYNLEYGWCGPEQLDGIMRNVLGVESPRHLDMMDRRRTYEALMDGIPKRSQTPEVDYLVSTLMRAGVKRQEWQRCQVVSYDFDELHLSRRYELSAQDPGDGTISAFSFSPEHDVERATVSVWHGRENAVVVDDGDGSLYLESDPSVACGTVTYENPGRSIDVVFPDPVPSDETAWFYHEYFDSGTDLTDPEVHTRHEYLGDRSERIPGARRSSPVAATLYVYFRLDAGEEYYSGADEMSEECFSKAHSDYALRVALERVLPAFGVTEITYVDRIVVEAPLDEYAVNLPLEEGPADMMP